MTENCYTEFTPGIFVINENKKNEWGIGQIQSAINNILTIAQQWVIMRTTTVKTK